MNSGPIANIDGTNGFYMNNRAKNGSNQDCIRERGGRGLYSRKYSKSASRWARFRLSSARHQAIPWLCSQSAFDHILRTGSNPSVSAKPLGKRIKTNTRLLRGPYSIL